MHLYLVNLRLFFPDIAKEPRFTFDTTANYLSNTVYMIPVDDLYLLGVLNSACVWEYAKARFVCLGDPDKGGRFTLYLPICSEYFHSQRFNY